MTRTIILPIHESWRKLGAHGGGAIIQSATLDLIQLRVKTELDIQRLNADVKVTGWRPFLPEFSQDSFAYFILTPDTPGTHLEIQYEVQHETVRGYS